MKKTIWYKNWLNIWVKSELKPTKKNLDKIKKEKAQNGQAAIFTV